MSNRSNRNDVRIESYESTKRYYDDNAQIYAESTLQLSMDQSIELFSTHLRRGDRVIDLGCGSGRDLREFMSRGFCPFGFDLSYALGQIAAKYSECPIIVGDLRALPFGSGSFNGAWASASLHHLQRNDVPTALTEILRVLHVGGVFFSSVKCGDGESIDSNGRWFSYFQPEEWVSQLERVGFCVEESKESSQSSSALDKAKPALWFNCTARRVK